MFDKCLEYDILVIVNIFYQLIMRLQNGRFATKNQVQLENRSKYLSILLVVGTIILLSVIL